MALFGDMMQQVVTPDGRQITVPAQLAQAFPGLKPFTPPEVAHPPELPVAPPFSPQPADQLQPPPQPSAPQSPQPEPVPAPEPKQPVVKPVTNAQLAQMGPAGAANVELEAQTEQRAAVERQGEALANQATAIGDEMALANEHAEKLLLERQQYAEQRAADLQSATDALTREAKSISDVRVDRSVDHPVLAALSAALIGVGQAMGRQPIDAMGAVYKAIDRKVAAQMADLDQRRANYGMQKDALGMQRQAGRDRLDEMDAHRLAYLDQARRQLEEIKQKTSSDVIRSGTGVLQAELDKESAKTVSTAYDRFAQRQDAKEARDQQMQAHREQLALGYAQMDSANARAILERDAAAATARAKGDEARAKLIQERAMGGEVTTVKDKDGNPVLDKDGNPQVQIGLITDAKGDVWIPKGTEASVTTLQKQHNASVAVIRTLDEIRKLGPEWLLNTANSDKLQRLKQLHGDLTLQVIAAKELGVPTGRDVELALATAGTTDPTRFRDSLAGIETARKSFVRNANIRLQTAGLDREWSPPDLGKKGSTEMPGDSELKSMQRAPSSKDWKAAFGGDPYASPRTFKGEPTEGPSSPAKRWIAEHGEITPGQISMIDQHGDALKAQDATARRKAGAWLEQVAKTGGTPTIRAYATQKLTNAVSTYAGESQATETAVPTGRSVARETVPVTRPQAAPEPKQRRDSAGNPY